jgi:hypothetical protein
MTTTRCWKDKEGVIELIAYQQVEANFPLLSGINFLFSFVAPTRKEKNGRLIIGQAKKLGNNVRDVFDVDFIIEMSHEIWSEMDDEQKVKAVWHELNHCGVKLDDNGEPEEDEHDRIKTYIKQHDVCLNTFQEEIDKFGLDSDERKMVVALVEGANKREATKKRK